MKNHMTIIHKGLMWLFVIMLLSGTISVNAAKGTSHKPDPSMLSKCRADLAFELNIKEKEITLADAKTVVWPDASLGLPDIEGSYTPVKTPGEQLILKARGSLYLYTTSSKTIRYGGPLTTWAYSMLCVKPVMSDPNLNGDLYQCSLIGTNGTKVVSGVSDYYPQANGNIVIKRRTSRSGHDLLYINADNSSKEKMLYQAFDFGPAALDIPHDRWAGFVRPMVGAAWIVVVGQPGQADSKVRQIDLPEGVKTEKIAWSGDKLMILVKKDDRSVAYETNPAIEASKWKLVDIFTFPGQDAYMLNKSESLEIEQFNKDDDPNVEVARVWFTGDRNVVAMIGGFTMQSYDLLGSYAFMWGNSGSHPDAYTVDIRTGEILRAFPGKGENIKPFAYPPHNSPIPKAPKMD